MGCPKKSRLGHVIGIAKVELGEGTLKQRKERLPERVDGPDSSLIALLQ